MDEKLLEKLKYLRLPELIANWDHYLKTAAKGNFSHNRLLETVIDKEYKTKKENSRQLRIRMAKIPEKLAMETFPFASQPRLNKKK